MGIPIKLVAAEGGGLPSEPLTLFADIFAVELLSGSLSGCAPANTSAFSVAAVNDIVCPSPLETLRQLNKVKRGDCLLA